MHGGFTEQQALVEAKARIAMPQDLAAQRAGPHGSYSRTSPYRHGTASSDAEQEPLRTKLVHRQFSRQRPSGKLPSHRPHVPGQGPRQRCGVWCVWIGG